MIYTGRTITVGEQESTIDKPILLYRGDRDILVEFTLVDDDYSFADEENVIKSTNASHGQLVLNTPSGKNMFTDVTKCEEGKVRFLIIKEMIDELDEVGLYSFQIRLFDESMISRVSIPPVMNGFELRRPIAAEDENNLVGLAYVDYSIIQNEEEIEEIFNEFNQYNRTGWQIRDVITSGKLNKIENALFEIHENTKRVENESKARDNENQAVLDLKIDSVDNRLDSKIDSTKAELQQKDRDLVNDISTINSTLKSKADVSFVNNKVFNMSNMGQDVREAMTGGSVAVLGEDMVLSENIVDGQVTARKIQNAKPINGANIMNYDELKFGFYYNGATGVVVEGASSTGLNCITPLYPVTPGEIYWVNKDSNCILFNGNKEYIQRLLVGGLQVGQGKITIPDDINSAYIGLSLKIAEGDTIPPCIRRYEDNLTCRSDYAIEWPELRVNDFTVSDVWLFEDETSDYNVVNETLTINWKGAPKLYLTHSYKPQESVIIDVSEPLVLPHNTSWVYNIHSKEFSIISTPSGVSGKWHNAGKGDILLLKNASGRMKAGRLSSYVSNRLTNGYSFTYNDVFWTGSSIEYGLKDGTTNTYELKISGGGLFARNNAGGNSQLSLSGGVQFDIQAGVTSQLIWDIKSGTIRVEQIGTAYSLNNNEVCLLYFQYGIPVSGALYKYIPDVKSDFNAKSTFISAYDRYPEGLDIKREGQTFTITIDHTNSNPWRTYIVTSSKTGLTYTNKIPDRDVVYIDDVETVLDTTTWTLPHNGMLYINANTLEYHTELLTDKKPYTFKNTGDVLLLMNIQGNFVAGELKDAFNQRLLEKEIASSVESNAKYDMGRLKFKFDVDPDGSYISSESLVGDELWVFPVSNDEGTNYVNCARYKMDFENNTATKVGAFKHNWGHVNSSSYNPWRDAIICGNGSGSYSLMGKIFIFENASSFKNVNKVDRSEAVTINVEHWGYKANVVWGESNMGRGDICYVITNDAQNVRKVLLGMGSNNLGSGEMIPNKMSNEFNGTYKVLGEWVLPRIDVVQGSNYENGALYIGLGHDTAWYTKNHLKDDGTVKYETYKEKFYKADGTQLYCNMQGITVTDKYVILGLQGGGLPTNQIHVYHR